MTKVFKYGVLVVIFSCVLVFFSSSSPSIPTKTPVEVANFPLGVLTHTIKLAT